ncbi:hypothetical protein Cylst_2569 [Cylindrospermum stagnale PCC 7417]|uniref:Uncharacterized protein n=1 Tax=Cylindrospermum stagnale PCC 7417 TaxID=56107 RepID=K9WWL6_9NOST|nr:hypothetical protein [Cylindrospermum stagnale]AFZ24775.1 hypothetical protein Cylst_2569 [Cylindrospermum stagnale PCC 7417]
MPPTIDNLLRIEIPLFGEMSDDEIQLRIDQEEIAYLARQAFCKGAISFQEYLDVLETVDVEMDNYVTALENDLVIIGVM